MKRVFLSALVVAGLMCSCEKTTEIDMSTEVTMSTSTMTVSNNNVKNGDTIDLTTNVKAVINGKSVLFTVVYYCDDNEIGSSRDSTNNYLFKYVVKDLSIGSHKLTSKASYQEGGASSSTTASYSINVIARKHTV